MNVVEVKSAATYQSARNAEAPLLRQSSSTNRSDHPLSLIHIQQGRTKRPCLLPA